MPHYAKITLETGGYVKVDVTCDEPEGAECRLVCQLEGGPCDDAYGDKPCEHLGDSGHCNHAEWLTTDTLEYYVATEDHVVGTFNIVTTWDGGDYTWTFAEMNLLPEHESTDYATPEGQLPVHGHSQCDTCGCLVGDRAKHDAWHQQLHVAVDAARIGL